MLKFQLFDCLIICIFTRFRQVIFGFKMSQQNPSTSTDYGASLEKRLTDLNDVDRKIAELMETTKEIISNLEKDKQVINV